MSGTKLGGQRAAATNKLRYGMDFYVVTGTAGGKKSRKGGFATDTVGSDGLTGRQRARLAGSRGGKASRRG